MQRDGWALIDNVFGAERRADALARLSSLSSVGDGWRSSKKLHVENLLDAGETFELF